GLPGNSGAVDGVGSAARFTYPSGVAVDAGATVYVADTSNHAIRRITSGGKVSTFAGTIGSAGYLDNGSGLSAKFRFPNAVAVDTSGNLYVADSFNHAIRKVSNT